MQEMKAFWVPSKAPDARQVLAKPDGSTFCPASGKKLRLKDLIPVKFTRTPEEDSGVYMDPVTQDTFTNASSLVVLRPTGKLATCTILRLLFPEAKLLVAHICSAQHVRLLFLARINCVNAVLCRLFHVARRDHLHTICTVPTELARALL